jgi:prepilin-type N-terminal cleavage/methylation domain-containing protein
LRGYTIVELVVVMAIIAILSILSASAFINARNQATASDATEQILSALREAQNRAISITKGSGLNNVQTSDETKAWGVRINGNAVELVYFDAAPNTTAVVMERLQNNGALRLTNGVTINATLAGNSTLPRYVIYTSPFAKPYTLVTDSNAANWILDQNSPTLDWNPGIGGNGFSNQTDTIRINIQYRGATQAIIVNSKGDAYIE